MSGVRSSRLQVVVRSRRPNHPEVRLLVDGVDALDPTGQERGNDPAHLLDTGALLPGDPPRRVALYGCGCGLFGCGVVAPVISEVDGVVHWRDPRTVTGAYGAALPEPEDLPDPVLDVDVEGAANAGEAEPAYSSRRLPLPDLAFDAREYDRVVRAAMADRSWETRTRAVVRLLEEARPELAVWAEDGERIALLVGDPRGRRPTVDVVLDVPPGPAADVARRLLDLLDGGADPRRVARDGIWR